MKLWVVAVAGALAAGCSPAATTLRLDIDAAPGVTVEALTLRLAFGGDAGASEALPQGQSAPPTLPGRAVVRLPDVAMDVAVALDGSAADGSALHAAATVRTVPHAQVTAQLTLGDVGDLGGDDAGDLSTPPPPDLYGCTLGARCGFAFERRLTITNNSTSTTLPAGYAVRVPLDAASFPATEIRADYGDVRLFGDAPDGEHPRVVDAAPPGQGPALWFALTNAIAPGASDTSYAVVYDNPSAGAPPADATQVFLLWDDFSAATPSPIWKVNPTPTFGDTYLGATAVRLHRNAQDALTTPDAVNDKVPTLSVLEWRAATTDPASTGQVVGSDTFWWWIGYQHTGDFTASDPWIVWISRGANNLQPEVDIVGTACNTCTGAAITSGLDAAYHWYRVERDATETRFYRDGVLDGAPLVDANTTDYSPMIRNYATTSDLYVDWIRARQLVSPEPTVAVGPEQPVQ